MDAAIWRLNNRVLEVTIQKNRCMDAWQETSHAAHLSGVAGYMGQLISYRVSHIQGFTVAANSFTTLTLV